MNHMKYIYICIYFYLYSEKMEQEMADIPDLSPDDRIWFSGSFYAGGDPMTSRIQRTVVEPASRQIPVYRYVGADGNIDPADSMPDPPDDWEEGMPLPADFELVGYEEYKETTDADALRLLEAQFNDHCDASEIRLVVAAAVTSPEGGKSLAHEVAEKVFDHLKAGTDNDPRIAYQLLVYSECKKVETESDDSATSDPQVFIYHISYYIIIYHIIFYFLLIYLYIFMYDQ